METGEGWRLGHRPALDGLRGIAVLLVVACHFDTGQFDGGALGVSVFFTLSGFLITALLLDENHRTGRINLPAFYVRRARRLLPALAALLAVAGALQAVGVPIGLSGGLVASMVGYATNWYLFVHTTDEVVPWGAITHTWSLAIEEQFYLAWPLLLIFLARYGRRALLVGAVAGSGLSLGWWVITGHSSLDSGVSAWPMLAGCTLAIALTGSRERRPWPLVGPLAVGGLLVLAVATPSVPNVEHIATPLLSCVAIWVAAQSPAVWGFSSRWLVWFGHRSYGLYLWHAMIAALAFSVLPWGLVLAVGLPLSIGMTMLSWRFIEAPFLASRSRQTAATAAGSGPGSASSTPSPERTPERSSAT